MSDPTPSAVPRGRLVRKYVVVLLVLVGGVLMASSLVELYFAYQETKRAIVREERARAAAAAAQIERFVKEVERQVRETTRAASDDPAAAQLGQGKLAFRGGLGAALADQRELDFLRLLRDVPAISELSHLDVSGREQLRVSRVALDAVGSQEDFSQAPKFLAAKSGKTYWSPVYLRNGVEPYLTLAVPVGQYAVEVTTAEISLKAVQQAIAQAQIGPGGYAYVVDSQGHLFAHPDVRLVRQKRDLSALPQVRGARTERPAQPGGPGGVDDSGMVAEGLQGGQILAAHAGIAPLGWLVLVERPVADAYAPLQGPDPSERSHLRAGPPPLRLGEHRPRPADGGPDPPPPGRSGANRRRGPRAPHRRPHGGRARSTRRGIQPDGGRGSRSPTRTSSRRSRRAHGSWRTRIQVSLRPSSNRQRPARSCASSRAPRPTSSRYSTPSRRARFGSATQLTV